MYCFEGGIFIGISWAFFSREEEGCFRVPVKDLGLVNPNFYMNVTDVIADCGMLGGTANAALKSQVITRDIYTILATSSSWLKLFIRLPITSSMY